jgi:molybdate transport system regulatory protein
MRQKPALRLRPRLRILRDEEIVLGPGKADLLGAIARTGNLKRAAASLGMSYMRAWKLVQVMNRAFREPLVETARGGSRRGSARLTATGRLALALYRRMERQSLSASRAAFGRLAALIP